MSENEKSTQEPAKPDKKLVVDVIKSVTGLERVETKAASPDQNLKITAKSSKQKSGGYTHEK